uniref:CB1 cannabinoid receptor-interacting protein 1 n=1 Tax=Toxocara canis TaxID=6265 RepID=A0A183U316_TOXCA
LEEKNIFSKNYLSILSLNFLLHIIVENADSGEPIVFKSDGSRFETSTRTLKLYSNARYKLTFFFFYFYFSLNFSLIFLFNFNFILV